MQQIQIVLPEKNYLIEIDRGLLTRLGTQLTKLRPPRKIAVITDSHVAQLYKERVNYQLREAGFQAFFLEVAVGEQSKAMETANHLYQQLIDAQFCRSDTILALGGGVVGDLAGFVASTFMRGIGFIQMPTSLLAQVDSSVGGKTAINLGKHKNVIGTFYQPDAVYIDPEMLATLPDRYLAEGYAEIVKMSALAGGDFWHMTGELHQLNEIRRHVDELIEKSVHYKADLVIADEKDKGIRQFLNFGHTMGHAIELLADGRLAHGEAISIGMVELTQRFEACGLSQKGTASDLKRRLRDAGLPLQSSLIGTADFYRQLSSDKKNHDDALHLVYLKAPGSPALLPIRAEQIKSFL